MIPDLSDNEKMAHLGRRITLQQSRKEAAEALRDMTARLLGNLDESDRYSADSFSECVTRIKSLTAMIKDNK